MEGQFPRQQKTSLGIFWPYIVSIDELDKRTGCTRMSVEVKRRRWRFLGHVLRMPKEHHCVTARTWTPMGKKKVGHRESFCRKCDIWLTVDNNLGLANALSYHTSHRVYDLWITLLFHLFFGATSLETESSNRVLVWSLLIGDATFVFLYCISCTRGSLKCRLGKV